MCVRSLSLSLSGTVERTIYLIHSRAASNPEWLLCHFIQCKVPWPVLNQHIAKLTHKVVCFFHIKTS